MLVDPLGGSAGGRLECRKAEDVVGVGRGLLDDADDAFDLVAADLGHIIFVLKAGERPLLHHEGEEILKLRPDEAVVAGSTRALEAHGGGPGWVAADVALGGMVGGHGWARSLSGYDNLSERSPEAPWNCLF